MSFRVARMSGGVVSEILDEIDGPVTFSDGRAIAWRHIKTWVRQNDQLLTKYGLVGVTTPAKPTFNPLKQTASLIRVVVGDAKPEDRWEITDRPAAEVRQQFVDTLKDRAWDLWGRSSWDKARTAWLDHRDALKTHGTALLQAFDQGRTVDPDTGSIDGVGAWPV